MKRFFSLLAALAVCFPLFSQEYVGDSCTSLMVGKKASADGSVITSHTCDGRYRTWVQMEPAADHEPGTMHPVLRGTMHTRFRGDTVGVKLMGEIPQAAPRDRLAQALRVLSRKVRTSSKKTHDAWSSHGAPGFFSAGKAVSLQS